jgi:hypothetical protein
MMNWLVWKDYKENRVAVYSALFFMVVPHFVVLGIICREVWLGLPPRGPHDWAEYFGAAALCGFMFAQLSIAIIGGNAFAGERTDRSAEFLFSLPISRGKIVLSKLLVSLALFLAIWLTTAVLLACLILYRGEWELPNLRDLTEVLSKVVYAAIVSTTLFCVAWCLSSFQRSSMLAALGGLITPWLVMMGIMLIGYMVGANLDGADTRAMVPFNAICLTIALPCFALGTWYYLQRVEP